MLRSEIRTMEDISEDIELICPHDTTDRLAFRSISDYQDAVGIFSAPLLETGQRHPTYLRGPVSEPSILFHIGDNRAFAVDGKLRSAR